MKLIHSILLLPVLFTLAVSPVRAAVDETPFQELKSYDFQNRKPVEAIRRMIREAAADDAALAEIETRLLGVLEDPAATFAAQQEVGRMLWTVGTARSVPALAKMLTDEKASDVARYALERIADPAAGKALRDALAVAKGKSLVGIINSLGNRRDAIAVAALQPLAGDQDAAVADAAITALSRIGTPAAIAILQAQPNKSLAVYQALLASANRMQQQNQSGDALAIYRQIVQDKTSPMPARLAATRGVLTGDPEQSMPLLVELLRGDDADLRGLAVRFVREMPAATNAAVLVAAAEKLPSTSQVLLLGALADRGDRSLLPVLLRAAASEDADVRLAALRGFATMEGTADAVMLLAKAAVQAKGGPEKDAARASLAAMRGATVDDAIMAAIPGAEATIRNELILSLGQRAVKGAKPLLFRLAADADPAVQNAALGALGEVAGVNDYPAAAKLLLETKNDAVRGAAENLVVRLARQVPTEGDRTAPLLAGVVGAPVETKISLLKVLGAMGGTAALNAVRAELKSDDPKVQDATVRALAATPDAAALNDLLDIAKSSQNKVHRVLALRGYLRLVDASAGRAGADLKLYEPVIPLATDASEKKTLISGLGRINSPEALAVVAPMLDDEAVRNEAASAVIGMARGISGKNPREARTALEKVVALVKDEAIVKQANDVSKGIPAS